MTSHVLTAQPGDDGLRLDVFVARQVPGVSRAQAQRLIREGHVTVGRGPVKPGAVVRAGTDVSVVIPPPAPAVPAPEPLPLRVLYEDADLAVVDKPAGMVVHPGAGHAAGTLVNALLHHMSGLSGVGGALRPGIVHRLDKGTSGLMVVAKHDAAHRALARQFHDRTVEKEYVALVWGRLEAGRRIDRPIGRDRRQRLKMSTRAPRARAAVTTVVAAEALGPVTLARLLIGTGRTHQIRVHLSDIGHPVVGDALYGGVRRGGAGRSALAAIDRPFLHAARLAFAHPKTGEAMTFESPLPAGLLEVLERLKANAARTNHDHLHEDMET